MTGAEPKLKVAKHGELPRLELGRTEIVALPPQAEWLQSAWVVYGGGIGLQLLLFVYFWQALGGNIFDLSSSWGLLIALVIFLPLHEVLHGAMHAKMGLSEDTIVGLSRHHSAPFCIYRKPMSRARAIGMAMAPFLVMTVAPVILSFWDACPAGLAVLAVLNAAGCGLDLSFAYYAWRYLPPGCVVGYDQGNLRIVLTAPASAAA